MDLRAVPTDLVLAAAAVLSIVALAQTWRLAWQRAQARRLFAARRERGARGEVRAEALLRRLGYTILGRQVAVSYGVVIDGESVAIDLRADYVVALEERRFVAEVKTGRLAPRIDTSATRRQLLEYRIAFDVDGVLLVDAETDRVRQVVFPFPGPGPAAEPSGRIAWLVAGVIVGAVATIAARFAP